MRRLKQRARAARVLRGVAGCGAVCLSAAQPVLFAQDAPRGSAGGCARTPAGAVQAAKGAPGLLLVSQQEGYRVKAVRWDALQHQSWAVVENCGRPDLPSVMLLRDLPAPADASGGGTAKASAAPVSGESISSSVIRANAAVMVVRAGESVRLWKSDSRAHIELIATAEENGTVGARVRVRLVTPKEADGQTAPPQFLAGVVRGPADVEIEP